MSLLSFIKFPCQMPDGFVQTGDYETKGIFPSEFRMQFCVVTKEGRFV